jgi:ribonucleoside-diphosphate reductase alpha chain
MEKVNENGLKVMQERYMQDNESCADDVFRRVAKAIASVETGKSSSGKSNKRYWERKFLKIMSDLDFLPNTPCLANAGKPNGQLAGCFVLPVEDDIEGIFDAIKWGAIVHKTGGGTGYAFSRLRPSGSQVKDSGGIASGPVSFMRVFDAATAEMKQGGLRRGANMGILRVDHPNILEFIKCKRTEGRFSNFNISVGITDEFMEAIAGGWTTFNLRHSGPDGDVEVQVDPHEIWHEIIRGAWENGEPGVVFLDTIAKTNPLSEIETIESTNPCAEQPLPPFGTCILGSINLSNMVNTRTKDVNYPKLAKTVATAVRFLDNAIDVTSFPLRVIEVEAKSKRRIGLGIMGLADLLIKMKITYGTQNAREITEEIMKKFQGYAVRASIQLGEEKGVPPLLNDNRVLPHLKTSRRNALITTIAPTGSLSIVAGCSSGCEPVFSFHFTKKAVETELDMVHPLVADWVLSHAPEDSLPDYFIEARDIPVKAHIRMQAVLQKYIDSGISKTINAPSDITLEETEEAFIYAYEQGLKSVAFYREGSRKFEAQKAMSKLPEPAEVVTKYISSGLDTSRPKSLHGETVKIMTGRGKLYITINEHDGQPFEVFLKIGKSGREDFAYSEALGRMISLLFRTGVSVEKIVKHLRNISGADVVWYEGKQVKSVPDAVAIILEEKYLDSPVATENGKFPVHCPECDSENVGIQGNCLTCKSCGYSKCD